MSENNSILEISNLKKTFEINGQAIEVLGDVSLRVCRGEFVSIIGASGCGKSTLLKLIMSLERPTAGSIKINGEEVVSPSPLSNMIFQEPRLFPWLSVRKNIAFTLPKSLSKDEKRKIIEDRIALVGLQGFEDALPHQLSGGMQQRVNLARALATQPEILLLDEPFGALDAFTRINMQEETLKIQELQKMTMLLVTHDVDEAIYLSDRIIVLSAKPGNIKADIAIGLPRARDRSSLEFLQLRRTVLLALFEKTAGNKGIEYYI